jgi:heme A synthase
VTEIHLVVGVAVVVLNAAAALWGAAAWLARRASVWFWYLLRTAQVSVILQVLLGALLLISGREAKEGLHYVYGTFPLLVNLFAEGMRVGAAQREIGERDFETLDAGEQRQVALRSVRREMGVMTVAALLVVAFAVRAAQVSGKLF